MTASLLSAVSKYGYLAIVALMSGEACGLPIPSEAVVPTAGILAAGGRLNPVAVVAAAVVGELIGSLVAYGLAARWGTPLLLGPGKYVGIRAHHVEIAQRWFGRYGQIAVFAGRLLPVIRTYISFPAGLARVPLGRFILLTLCGAIPWNTGLVVIGYFLGRNYEHIAQFIQRGGYVLVALAVIVIAVWWVRGRRAARPTASV
ncbi:MAG TPA: DedA family protein [Candidatus Dormibacteraeota bacterium]